MKKTNLLFVPFFALAIVLASPLTAQEETPGIEKAWEAAHEGKYEQVINAIKQYNAKATSDTEKTFAKQVGKYLANRDARSVKSKKAYDEAIAEMVQDKKDEKWLEALNDAIIAGDTIGDYAKLLEDEAVAALYDKAVKLAKTAEKEGNWIDATAYYFRLNQLSQPKQVFSEDTKRVSRHLRVLRSYAPKQLHQLYVDRAKRLGEDEPEANIDEDEWKREVKGARRMMLLQAMSRAELKHVEVANYRDMLIGGYEVLSLVLNTKGIDVTFDGMTDQTKLAAMKQFVDGRIKHYTTMKEKVGFGIVGAELDLLMKQNKETVALPEEVLFYEFGDGAMGTLDNYTAIIWPSQKKYFDRTTSGEFSGVGIQISRNNGEIEVISPIEGSPAHAAGIIAGERIVEINGENAVGISVEDAVDQITGKAGTKVVLGIKNLKGAVRQVEIVRQRIKLISVRGWERKPEGGWNYYLDKPGKIGYVRMSSFGPNSAEEMDKAVFDMIHGDGLNGLILDLRGNPGGLLSAAIDVSNRFLKEGTIVSAQGPSPSYAYKAKADSRFTYPEFPVVVLINRGSASASEIVSGALQAHSRALIIGERSFGKGSVQQIYGIDNNNAYMKLTTQYYKLPDGRIIHRRPMSTRWGVSPDINIHVTGEQAAELAAARNHLDILRDQAAAEKAAEVPTTQEAMTKEEEELWKRTHPKSAEAILDSGLDPQLSTSLLMLRMRVVQKISGRAEAE